MLDSNRRGFFRALLGLGAMAAGAKVVEKIPMPKPDVSKDVFSWDNSSCTVWTLGYLAPAQTIPLTLTYSGTSYTDFTFASCGTFEVTNG